MLQLLYLALLLLTVAGLIVLQIFLSKKKSLFPGLVLPLLSLLLSIVMVCSMAAYAVHTVEERVNGVVTETQSLTQGNSLLPAGGAVAVFFMGNLPTLLFLGIYLSCHPRKRDQQQEELDRMHIQDL